MTRIVHRFVLAVVVTVTLSSGLLGAAPARADERPHAPACDVLALAQHVGASLVTVRSRTPVPSTVTERRPSDFGPVAVADAGDRHAIASHRHAPLYALLGVYRL